MVHTVIVAGENHIRPGRQARHDELMNPVLRIGDRLTEQRPPVDPLGIGRMMHQDHLKCAVSSRAGHPLQPPIQGRAGAVGPEWKASRGLEAGAAPGIRIAGNPMPGHEERTHFQGTELR